ncbi:EIF3C factor, partial [Polypterus senegalus]
MAPIVRDLLLQSLNELLMSHLRNFKGRLSDQELTDGSKIPCAAIEEAEDRDSLADLLIRYCTDAKVVHVMVAVVRRYCFNNEAGSLLQRARRNSRARHQRLAVPGSVSRVSSIRTAGFIFAGQQSPEKMEEKLLHILNAGTEKELKSLHKSRGKKALLILGGRKMLTRYISIMSRFFATGSDSESEETSSGDEVIPKQVGTTFAKQPVLLSDDEEDTKRVVRSTKDKRFEELTNIIKTIRNAMKIRDVSKCLEEFEQLYKAFLKSKTVVDKEGVPTFYIRLLADLEDYLNELWEDKEGKKKMNKNNAKALSTLRQKIRKYNRDYEAEIVRYKENPEQSADEEEERDEDDSDESDESEDDKEDDDDDVGMSPSAFLKKQRAEPPLDLRKKKIEDEEDEEDSDDDEDWGSDSDDSDSESDDDEGKHTSLASRFLKKTTSEEDRRQIEKKKEDKVKKKQDRKLRRVEEDDEEGMEGEGEGEWKKVEGGAPLVKEKRNMFAKGTEINIPVVLKKLNEILQARGKKGTDRAAQIELLHCLSAIAAENNLGEGILVKIKFNIIASLYDYNPNLAAYMKVEILCCMCVYQ